MPPRISQQQRSQQARASSRPHTATCFIIKRATPLPQLSACIPMLGNVGPQPFILNLMVTRSHSRILLFEIPDAPMDHKTGDNTAYVTLVLK